MGIFSSLFGANPKDAYKTKIQYESNRLTQIAMTPQTMEQLRKLEVTDSSRLKLEYFFYTNTEEKAASLNKELQKLGHNGGFDSASNSKEYVINGWSARMSMDDKTVAEWTALMCDLGKDNDCEFDGWGTNPSQENE